MVISEKKTTKDKQDAINVKIRLEEANMINLLNNNQINPKILTRKEKSRKNFVLERMLIKLKNITIKVNEKQYY